MQVKGNQGFAKEKEKGKKWCTQTAVTRCVCNILVNIKDVSVSSWVLATLGWCIAGFCCCLPQCKPKH